jgi:glycosyltransferase involved in cell wall biosynthesis
LKKILFITPQLPYPPVSGGVIKTFELVKFLHQKYDIFLATLLKSLDREKETEFLSFINSRQYYGEVLDRSRSIKNILMSWIKRVPINVYRNESNKFKSFVKDQTKWADIIFVDHYFMFQYVPNRFRQKVVLHEHNAEYVLWKKASRIEKNIIKKCVALYEGHRVRKYEKRICLRASSVLCVTPNDIKNLEAIGVPRSKCTLAMTLGDPKLLERNPILYEETERALLCIGTLTWEPNIDGLLWFIRHCWRPLKSCFPDLKFYIVGNHPDVRLQMKSNKENGIVLTGFVEDVESYYSRSRVFVCPLRFGSGIKVKIMNALYRGIPVVTTTTGAEGIDLESGKNAIISDDPSTLISQIGELVMNKARWESLRDNSRNLARTKYAWDIVFEAVSNVIDG